MTQLTDELRANIARMPDAELLKITRVDCGRYPTPTLLLAREELVRRGLTSGPAAGSTPAARSAEGLPSAAAAPAGEPGALRYGGFWRRFGAYWLDLLILLPIVIPGLWLQSRTRYSWFWLVVPSLLITVWYHVYLVKRFAATPGKFALDLRILREDGTPVGYRESFLRQAVDLGGSQLIGLALALAALQIPEAEYATLTFRTRAQRLSELAPFWYSPLKSLFTMWVWSEFVVMLTNKKRRALHDYLAGTIVVHQAHPTAPS